MALVQTAAVALGLTSLVPQSARTQTTQAAITTADGLAPISQSNTFILTTATTQWAAPTFAPLGLPCSNTMCPALDGKTCVDTDGVSYGVLCNQRLSGIFITSSGKKRRDSDEEERSLEDRSYTGSVDACGNFCDQFDSQYCVGFGYAAGICTLYAAMQGTIAQTGGVVCVRQQ